MSSKNKLIINCGTTHVSAAEFAVSAGGLVLEKFQTQELLYDYSLQDEWLPALSKALKAMKLSGKASLIVPASWILTKTIKVPHIDGGIDRQREVIRFEAEKNIPYALSEVTWDYQIISDDGVETEMLLASMKATAADDFCSAIAAAGVQAVSIQASSILEYNTWKYCGLEDDVIILNIGAKSSNMLIARGDGLFVRSIPIGGNAFTQAISDARGQSFLASEEQKRKFFSNEKEFAGAAGADQFITTSSNVMRRISMEIKRSILNYRRKGRVSTPTKILLSGRASLLPSFSEFLAEDQNMSVSYFDALSKISISHTVDQNLLKACASQMGELVGEAARMVLSDSMGVNLLPQHIVEERAFKKKKPIILMAAALLLAATVPPFMKFQDSISLSKKLAGDFNKPVAEMQNRIQSFEENKLSAERTFKKISDLEGLAKSKSNWIHFFIDMEQRLAAQKDVWLDNLSVIRTGEGKNEKYNLKISGRMLLRENAQDLASYDPKVALEKINPLIKSFTSSSFLKSYQNVTTDNSNPRIIKFDLVLLVNPDKPI